MPFGNNGHVSATASEPRRGRPRDPSRDRALLQSARQVIAERGVAGATMDDIARRAGCGKDTLYRRWSSKEQLTVDLIDLLAGEAVRPAPIDPDPRVNLLMYLKDIVRLNQRTEFGAIVASVVGASALDADLAEGFRAFWARRREIAASLVREVVDDRTDDAEMAVLLDRLLGPIYYRLLLTGDEISDEYLWDLVDQIPRTVGSGATTRPPNSSSVVRSALGSATRPDSRRGTDALVCVDSCAKHCSAKEVNRSAGRYSRLRTTW